MSAPSDETIREHCLQLVEQALPVRDQLPLLEVLVRVWQSATNSGVVVGLWDGDLLSALHQSAAQQAASFQSRLRDWDEAALLQRSTNDASPEAFSTKPSFIRTFIVDGNALGGVAVFGCETSPECLEPLVKLSGKLAAQWRAFDRDLRDRKLEAMAEFAAGAGHEINNPLATIAGRAMLLLRSETDPERRRSLETIGGQAYRVRDMIGDAMTFARPPQPQPTTFQPLSEVRTLLTTFATRFADAGIEVQLEGDEALTLTADREQFRVFVSCLLRNELEALNTGGTFSMHIARVSCGDREVVRFALQDNGPGLTEIDREHLFDPFYSGRPAGRGLGFGLSRCWRIVHLHGGDISAGGNADSGFWLTADWPACGQ